MSRRVAAEVMTSPVVTVTPETPLPDAADHRIKRLPVVNLKAAWSVWSAGVGCCKC